MKFQCFPYVDTNQFIHTANQLTGFYIRATLAFNGLNISFVAFRGVYFKLSQTSMMKVFVKIVHCLQLFNLLVRSSILGV